MSIKKLLLTSLTACMILTHVPLSFASSPKVDLNNPLSISYVLDQIEDKLEKNFEQHYKIDWDFEIIYNNGSVLIVIEYDKDDADAFKKISKADLEKLITAIASEIIATLGNSNIPIQGMIIEDDTNKPIYQFIYNNGKLYIK